MRYFAYVRLDGFYVSALRKGEPSSAPLVVHRDKRVIDAEAESGVRAGMTLSEAKSLARGARFVKWDEETFRDAQCHWLDIGTMYSDVIEPESEAAAFFDLSGHPDALDIHERLVRDLVRATGLTVSTGWSNTKWIARLAADSPGVPLGDLPVEALPVSSGASTRLRFLGYPNLKAVERLELDTLRKQFGDEGLLIFQACRGGVFQAVEALYPPEAITAHRRFDAPLEDRSALDLSIAYLARRLSRRLIESDRQGRTLEILVEDESGKRLKLLRTFAKPMQSARSIEVALTLQLGKLDQKLVGLYVKMPELEDAPRIQRELTGKLAEQERGNGVDQAFRHIRTVFGDQAIQVASAMPQARRTAVLRAWKDATGWV